MQIKDDGTYMAVVVSIKHDNVYEIVVHVLEKPHLGEYRKLVYSDDKGLTIGQAVRIPKQSKALEGQPLGKRIVV